MIEGALHCECRAALRSGASCVFPLSRRVCWNVITCDGVHRLRFHCGEVFEERSSCLSCISNIQVPSEHAACSRVVETWELPPHGEAGPFPAIFPWSQKMLKRFMLTTAAAALLATSAFAQTPAPPPPAAAPAAPATRTDAKFVTMQTADQWLGSKFKGTDVIGANNEKIGDVSDVLFDKDKVLAYVVGVG